MGSQKRPTRRNQGVIQSLIESLLVGSRVLQRILGSKVYRPLTPVTRVRIPYGLPIARFACSLEPVRDCARRCTGKPVQLARILVVEIGCVGWLGVVAIGDDVESCRLADRRARLRRDWLPLASVLVGWLCLDWLPLASVLVGCGFASTGSLLPLFWLVAALPRLAPSCFCFGWLALPRLAPSCLCFGWLRLCLDWLPLASVLVGWLRRDWLPLASVLVGCGFASTGFGCLGFRWFVGCGFAACTVGVVESLAVKRFFIGLALLAPLCGCAGVPDGEESERFLVVAVDGLEWTVLETLFAQGQLPNLKRLVDGGYSSYLETAFDASPVIWTTIATGVHPEVHGITDFVVPGPDGDRPVDSTTRRVPALWNMASEHGVATGFYGWWATWPAEEVVGELVSDLVLDEAQATAFPAALQDDLGAVLESAMADDALDLPTAGVGARDRAMVWLGARSLRERRFPLTAVYFRYLDLQSHYFWRLFQPEAFGGAPNTRFEDPVSTIYRQVDSSIGRLLDAAGEDANVVVLSDHGFRPMKSEEVRVQLDLDRLLEELGLLVRTDGKTDTAKSSVYSFDSRPTRDLRWLRFGSEASAGERSAVQSRLEELAARLVWGDGEPVFRVRPVRPAETARGIDLSLRILPPQTALKDRRASSSRDSACKPLLWFHAFPGPTRAPRMVS